MGNIGSPGRLIGRGRAADVYAIGAGRVLRRYRTPIDTGPEVRIMRHVAAAGYPVPAVYDVNGYDLVMERLDGPDMMADLSRRPWKSRQHARTLAELHNKLHEIAAPADCPRMTAGPADAAQLPGDAPSPAGEAVLHMDLHPSNVLLTRRGPVVIDWTNARAGAGGDDVAMSYLIMSTSEIEGVRAPLVPVMASLRAAFVRFFLAAVRDSPVPHIASVARLRMADPNIRPSEFGRLLRKAARAERHAH